MTISSALFFDVYCQLVITWFEKSLVDVFTKLCPNNTIDMRRLIYILKIAVGYNELSVHDIEHGSIGIRKLVLYNLCITLGVITPCLLNLLSYSGQSLGELVILCESYPKPRLTYGTYVRYRHIE